MTAATPGPKNLAIFDIDGTLLRTNEIDGDCFARAFTAHDGLADLDDNWDGYDSSTDSGLATEIFHNHLGRPPLVGEIESVKQRFFANLRRSLSKVPAAALRTPGAASLLGHLAAGSEWELAVATGAWKRSMALKLEAAELTLDGIPVATSDDADDRCDIIRTAIAKTRQGDRAGYRHIVYIGDRPWDVRAARDLGLSFLGVGSDGDAERLRAAGATRVVEDFARCQEVAAMLPLTGVPSD